MHNHKILPFILTVAIASQVAAGLDRHYAADFEVKRAEGDGLSLPAILPSGASPSSSHSSAPSSSSTSASSTSTHSSASSTSAPASTSSSPQSTSTATSSTSSQLAPTSAAPGSSSSASAEPSSAGNAPTSAQGQSSTSQPSPTQSGQQKGTDLASENGGSAGSMSDKTRNTVIGVVVGIGGAIIVGALGLVAWRVWGRRKDSEESDGLMDYDMGTGGFEKQDSSYHGAAPAPSPFKTTLENYHQPGQVNTSSNF